MLAVTLFGHLRISHDGRSVPFAVRPKVAPLLAYLLLNRDQPVSRDSVAFALWPDEPEESARANLRRHLHYLREALPSTRTPWVTTDARTVRWNPAARVTVDVDDFERYAADAASLEKAVGLYADLLQGHDDEWLIAVRERLHGLYVQSLWELVRQARGRRDGTAANDYLGRILADDPWREDALRALMTVRCESGDRSSALRLCTEFEQRLKDEMGAALMPETAALRHAIDNGNPLPAVSLSPAPQIAAAGVTDLPFAGRDAELSQLRKFWTRVNGGSGSLVLILGEAGIGKTRLAAEFALAVEAMGGRIFWGTTSAPETTPYQGFAEIARAAIGFGELSSLSPYDLDVLARLIPELRDGASPPDPSGGEDSERLFAVIETLFVQLARQRPALFVFEDLHNAGPATIAMLEHLSRRCSEAPILILATLREEELHSAETLRRLRRPRDGPPPTVIPLAPLSEGAVKAIVGQVLGGAADAGRIASRSAGHPLFLAEMLNAAADAQGSTHELPTRLRELIEARSRQLSSEAGFLLCAAAVVGASFDIEAVAETVGWSESRLAPAIDELVARRVIRQTPSARTFEYEFAHDLIASAAYDAVSERQRRHWHRRAGRAAEHLYASRLDQFPALIARHFELGGERDAAARYYLRAAESAVKVFANEEALAYARRGLGLRPSAPSDRYELLTFIEEVLGLVGERAQQGMVLRQLDRLVRRLGDVQRLLEVLRRRANLQFFLGERDAARRILVQVYQLASGDARWEAISLRGQAVILNHSGRKADAHQMVVGATTRSKAVKDDALLIETLVIHTDLAASLGLREEAEECLQQLKDAAARLGSIRFTMHALFCEIIVFTHFENWSGITEAAPRLLELASKVGNRIRAADAHTMLASALGRLFDLDDARRHFRAAIELYRISNSPALFFAYHNLAVVESEIGRTENAQHVLDEMGKTFPGPRLDRIRSELARQRGDHDNAIRLAESAVAAAIASGDELLEAEALLCQGLALCVSGHVARAVVALERCLTIRRGANLTEGAAIAAAELAFASALAGDARAGRFADEGLRLAVSDAPAPPPPAALFALSQALTVVGRTAEASDVLSRAHDELQTRLKRLRDRRDRAAFSQLRDNVELERAYASAAATAPARDASAETPPARRGPKTRTSDPPRPPAHSP